MKLRAIELTNVRRFANQTARLDGIDDGITVLSEPNEFGKSTFFDGLHALFFERYSGRAQAVKRLQPYSGGAPEVAAEIETDDGQFRIEKRWISKATVVVREMGTRIVAVDDEAEAWIERLVAGGLGGPAGLLWVRQGLLGLQPDARKEQEEQLEARRDLVSSVAGEIDMMTGGRRMDSVLSRLSEDLAELATSTGRPKAGGSWDAAQREAEELGKREAELTPKLESLSDALRGRTEAQRRMSALNDPELVEARRIAFIKAEAAFNEARAHADKLERAEQALKLAEAKHEALLVELSKLKGLSERHRRATDRESVAAETVAKARQDKVKAEEQEKQTTADLKRAEKTVSDLRKRLAEAQQAERASEAKRRAEQIGKQLSDAECHRKQKEAEEASAAALSITREAIEAAEVRKQSLDELEARQSARSVRLSFHYDGEARAEIEGRTVERDLEVQAPSEIVLPHFGRLHVDPGSRGTSLENEISQAQQQLRQALEACAGAQNLPEARRFVTEREGHLEAAKNAGRLLEMVAPNGLSDLAAKHAQLVAILDENTDAPTEKPEELESQLSSALSAEAAARGTLDAARTVYSETKAKTAAAEATHAAATAALEEAADALGSHEAHHKAVIESEAKISKSQEEVTTLIRERNAIAVNAPDIQTVEAALERARSAADQATKEHTTLTQRLAELSGAIRALADEGIEEELEEVRGRRMSAKARADRFASEVAALKRLQGALEQARSEAREAYFGPVVQELRPLLAILHGDASLEIDDKTLLPAALTRDGLAEEMDILSGGTREQVAILTRLAFGRLFARRGLSVPIILDDALVHSDDDRIEAMFTALHRVAKDQQVLVLTCRQRAFAALGGHAADVHIEANS